MNQRETLKSAYPRSKKWAKKVDEMSEDQVAAIIIRLKGQKKL